MYYEAHHEATRLGLRHGRRPGVPAVGGRSTMAGDGLFLPAGF